MDEIFVIVFFFWKIFLKKPTKKIIVVLAHIWGEFDLIRKYVVLGRFSKFNSKNVILERFSGIRNDQNSFFTLKSKSVICGIQEFRLTVHKENDIMGRFGLHICSTMKIMTEKIVVHILKSVVLGRFLGIRSDLKCLSKCHFEEIFTDIFFFYNLSFFGRFLRIRGDLKCLSKCHFGKILADIFFLTICRFFTKTLHQRNCFWTKTNENKVEKLL